MFSVEDDNLRNSVWTLVVCIQVCADQKTNGLTSSAPGVSIYVAYCQSSSSDHTINQSKPCSIAGATNSGKDFLF